MAFKFRLRDQHNMTKYLHTSRDYDEGKTDFDNDGTAVLVYRHLLYYKVKCQNKIIIIKKIIPDGDYNKNNNVDLQCLSQLYIQKVFISVTHSEVYINAELDTQITGDKSTPMT